MSQRTQNLTLRTKFGDSSRASRGRCEHLQSQPYHDRAAVLFRVTQRRLDLAGETIYLSHPRAAKDTAGDEPGRDAAAVGRRQQSQGSHVAQSRYGWGLRASEVVRLKVKHIDSARKIIQVKQSESSKDRNVTLSRRSICRANCGRRARRITMPQPRWRNSGCFPATSRASRLPPAS
jgi:integrase